MEEILNELLDLLEELQCKEVEEGAEVLYYKDNINLYKALFEALDCGLEGHKFLIYIEDNMEAIIKEIKLYVEHSLESMYQNGERFTRTKREDKNRYYAEEWDLMQGDWLDIDELDEELESNRYYGYMEAQKKDRSKNTYRPEELEW